jgi:hypothetical protein
MGLLSYMVVLFFKFLSNFNFCKQMCAVRFSGLFLMTSAYFHSFSNGMGKREGCTIVIVPFFCKFL